MIEVGEIRVELEKGNDAEILRVFFFFWLSSYFVFFITDLNAYVIPNLTGNILNTDYIQYLMKLYIHIYRLKEPNNHKYSTMFSYVNKVPPLICKPHGCYRVRRL